LAVNHGGAVVEELELRRLEQRLATDPVWMP
jgi:hypothetical protein